MVASLAMGCSFCFLWNPLIFSLPGAQDWHPGMPELWMEPCSMKTLEGRLYLEPGL